MAKIMAAARARILFGDFRPNVTDVAKDAKVSIRTIFEIYRDHDGLLKAALDDALTYDRLLCVLFQTEIPPWTIGTETASRIVGAVVFGRIIEGEQNAS